MQNCLSHIWMLCTCQQQSRAVQKCQKNSNKHCNTHCSRHCNKLRCSAHVMFNAHALLWLVRHAHLYAVATKGAQRQRVQARRCRAHTCQTTGTTDRHFTGCLRGQVYFAKESYINSVLLQSRRNGGTCLRYLDKLRDCSTSLLSERPALDGNRKTMSSDAG